MIRAVISRLCRRGSFGGDNVIILDSRPTCFRLAGKLGRRRAGLYVKPRRKRQVIILAMTNLRAAICHCFPLVPVFRLATAQGRVDGRGRGGDVEGLVEEGGDPTGRSERVGEDRVVAERQDGDAPARLEPEPQPLALAVVLGRERGVVDRRAAGPAAQAVEHGALRGDHLSQVALDDEESIQLPVGQVRDEGQGELDCPAPGLGQPGGIDGQSGGGLVLEVAAGVVLIGGAAAVGEGGDASGGEQLHEHRRAARGSPATTTTSRRVGRGRPLAGRQRRRRRRRAAGSRRTIGGAAGPGLRLAGGPPRRGSRQGGVGRATQGAVVEPRSARWAGTSPGICATATRMPARPQGRRPGREGRGP